MNKGLKWTAIIFGGILVLLLLVALIVPVVFKDDIKAAIDKQIAKSVNADVVFDVDDFSLSFFSNFPNITAEMNNLGVLNRAPFDGQVLFATQRFEVEVNLMDILFGDELQVKGITLVKPVINIKVLEDGTANYDIAIASEDTATTESGDFSFSIDHWEVVDGDVSYDDQSIPFTMVLGGLNHTGSGDFTQDVFDLRTRTQSDSVTVTYDGTEYISDKRTDIDAVLSISEEYSRYTFKENTLRINDFTTHFDGWFKMNEDNYEMDITFDSPENTFKSLLSLVPGMYTESFDRLESSGSLAFNGFVKGTYNESTMPAFQLDLKVNDGMFKYPDLPTPVNNVNIDLLVDNPDGVIEHTSINLKNLHMDFGSNPVDAKAVVENLSNYKMNADLKAKLNLAELTQMFPMEGLALKGVYSVDLNANGVYDSVRNLMPSVNANMVLSDGYVKSAEFPIPMEDMHFSASVKNNSGRMEETYIEVNDFAMLMDGERFRADLTLENLVNYKWDLQANGTVDLEKMGKVLALEGMALAGKLTADIATKGNYADLNAERYDQLPTSGTASLTGFAYSSRDLPYEVTISEAGMVFNPRRIELQKMEGKIGRSDFQVNGSVMNYLGYVFGKGETIKGEVNFTSSLLDLNEFMTDTPGAEEDTSSYGVVPVPKDIDFLLHSKVDRVRLMDFNITGATGDIQVKNGIADLRALRFNMLGGAFAVSGTYNTTDLNHPRYDLDLKVESLSIQQAANSLTLVQTYAPIAGLVKGNFSTDFNISGELQQDMSPKMSTVNADGLIKIAQATLAQSPIVAGVTSLTSLDNTNTVSLKDVLMSARITDGRLSVKPFDVKFGDYTTAVSGSTGLDGSIDYTLKMNVPAGKLGSQVQSFINKNTGASNPTDVIPVTIGLGNTYNDPKFNLLADEQKAQVTEAVASAAKEEGKKVLQDAVKGTDAEKIVGDILGTSKSDSASSQPDSVAAGNTAGSDDVQKKVEEEAKKKIQNLLRRKD